MRTAVETTHLEVLPGVPTRVEITVTNTSTVVDGVIVIVDGIDAGWIRQEVPILRLFPGETGVAAIDVVVPATAIAGSYLVVFRVESTISFDRHVNHDFWVVVPPIPSASVTVVPSVVTEGATAVVEALVTNNGNVATNYRLQALDPARELDCSAMPSTFRLQPGQTLTTLLTMSGPRPWFGNVIPRSVLVSAIPTDASVDDEPLEPFAVTFNQRARVARGVMTFLILAAIVTLWALIFYFIIQRIDSSEDLGKKAGTEFLTGETNIPIAKIAASVSGTVKSATEERGLPRISVTANRIVGVEKLLLSGATATDEDGNFELVSLLPGRYQLEFSADGFSSTFEHLELKIDAAADKATSDASTTQERTKERPQDTVEISLTGAKGTIVGAVDLPDDAAGTTFRVKATLVPVDPSGIEDATATEGVIFEETKPDEGWVTTDANGGFEIPELPTPATYAVRAEGVGTDMFAPIVYEVRVEGGDTAQPNPVRPIAQPGSIRGAVVEPANGGDAALGGVTVTVRSGDFSVETITPTRGEATYNLTGLPTPGEYVVTFSKEGYTGRTLALSLAAGSNWVEPTVTLRGGLGRVTGSVSDANGARGGVEIIVQGNGFIGQSSSLTTSSPTGSGGGVGSFVVSAIPIPGSYTVTYRLDGYESQTLPVEFDGTAVPQVLPPVTLTRRTGTISGVVVIAGSDVATRVADLEITLDDGSMSRRTSPTSSPPGSFSFQDIPAGSYTLTFRDGDDVLLVLLRRLGSGQVVDASSTITLSGPT